MTVAGLVRKSKDSSQLFITVNELTTVAAACMRWQVFRDRCAAHLHSAVFRQHNPTDQQHHRCTCSHPFLQNAFGHIRVNNLVNTQRNGRCAQTTPACWQTPVNGVRVLRLALGNILASCVNSDAVTGPSSPTNCYTLFNNAGSTGGATGTIPTDSARTAAIRRLRSESLTV